MFFYYDRKLKTERHRFQERCYWYFNSEMSSTKQCISCNREVSSWITDFFEHVYRKYCKLFQVLARCTWRHIEFLYIVILLRVAASVNFPPILRSSKVLYIFTIISVFICHDIFCYMLKFLLWSLPEHLSM